MQKRSALSLLFIGLLVVSSAHAFPRTKVLYENFSADW